MEGILLGKGSVRGFQVFDRQPSVLFPGSRLKWTSQKVPVTRRVPNTILYDAATIYAHLLAEGALLWRIATMYLEFANVPSPGDTVTPPVFTRGPDEGLAYYQSLVGSPDTDYLRVPVITGLIDSTDEDLFPGGNRVTFFAQSAGTEGTHGKEFSDNANSLVYGGGLVASPVPGNPDEDVVLARFYYDPADQIPKLASGQVGIEWSWTGQ